jgi:putative ABC transport system permease protein
MFLLISTFRRLWIHWRLNLAVLLILTLASALLAGLPSYASLTAERTLSHSLAIEHPVGRNIEIRGPAFSMSGVMYRDIKELLGDFIRIRMDVRTKTVMTDEDEPVIPIDNNDRVPVHFISTWSIDKMRDTLILVEGDWPSYQEPQNQRDALRPKINASISEITAEETGLKIGDKLNDNSGITFTIVGIIQPIDPNDDIWWGDPTTFKPIFRAGINEDTVFVPIFINPTSMKEFLLGHDISWRVVFDQDMLNADQVPVLEEMLTYLKTQLVRQRAEMTSNLPNILLKYRENLATIQIVLYLLSAQAILFILYSLFLVASMLMERRQGELAIMAGRGADSAQITQMLALEGLILALIAGFILGPILAWISINLILEVSGPTGPVRFPLDALLFSIGGALIGWIVLVISAYPIARRSVLEWKRGLARPNQFARWQRLYLDVILLVISGVIYWQLTTSGSVVLSRFRDTDIADPLLLLGPTLLLIAIALICLRLFPYILRIITWIAGKGRGIVLSLGSSKLTRDPINPSRVILLISLAVGLLFFVGVFNGSLDVAQQQIAYYQAGANLRLSAVDEVKLYFEQNSGQEATSDVFRIVLQNPSGKSTKLLAVDSQTFAQVAAPYPVGMTNLNLEDIMRVLVFENKPLSSEDLDRIDQFGDNPYVVEEFEEIPLPAIFSKSALPKDKNIGDQVQLNINPYELTFEVRGVIVNFPSITGSFILVDITALESVVNLDQDRFDKFYELWVQGDTETIQPLRNDPAIVENIIVDSVQELNAIINNPFIQGAKRAFILNASILAILSVAVFFIINYFSARQRSYEFGVLRANGMSIRQLIALLSIENILIMFIGLVIGTLVGIGLVYLMQNYMNKALADMASGMVVYHIVIDFKTIAVLYGMLVLAYFLALCLSIIALMRAGVHQILKIGEE